MQMVELFTDGACIPNPGRGGWAYLLRYKHHEKRGSGSVENTTNNRMEMQAVIEGLKVLRRRCTVYVYSDSQYVVNVAEGRWKATTNTDLWQELFRLSRKHQVVFQWVRGHAGHPENEKVNTLAFSAAAGR